MIDGNDGNDENEAVTVTTEDKQAIFDALVEITHQLSKQDEAKAQIKTIAGNAQGNFGIKAKYINKMAKVMYAKTFKDVQDEAAHFEGLYELIVADKGDEFAKD